MRIVIISDVHSNLVALEAVLRHAEAQGPLRSFDYAQDRQAQGRPIDAFWCLGDIVGYGPQPRECVARVREMGAVTVAGNHDRAGTGKMGTAEFNPDAARAARWTMGQLTPDEQSYLDALPEVLFKGEFTLVHGTLRWPIWEYLHSYEAARAHLERQDTPFSLVGHTHVPMLVVEGQEFLQGCQLYRLGDGMTVRLTRERKMAINPGAVGQPRDGDPRASYGVYDTEEEVLTLHRVEYDIAATQRLMEAARLPRWLIDRLALGR